MYFLKIWKLQRYSITSVHRRRRTNFIAHLHIYWYILVKEQQDYHDRAIF